ncbi:hypothetical protein Tco_0808221 [Tanacetum coccineum]
MYLSTYQVASQSSSPTTSTLEIPIAPLPPAPYAIVALSTDIISLVNALLVLLLDPNQIFSSGIHFRSSSSGIDSSGSSSLGILLWVILHPDILHQLPPLLIHLHHRDLFIHHLLGLHGIERPFAVRGMYRRRDIDIDVLADIKANAAAVEVVAGMDVEAGVDAGIGMEVDVGVDVEDEVEDEVESSDRGTMEVGVDVVAEIDVPDDTSQRVEDIKSGHRELEARSLIASGERAGLLDNVASLERSNASRHLDDGGMRLRRLETFAIMTITRSGMTPEAIEELINQRVVEALAAYEANRTAKLTVEIQNHNGDDDDNGNVRGNGNENGEGNRDGNGGGNENKNGGDNGNGNPNRNDRGVMPVARECTYHDFVKCQSLNFKGIKGVVIALTWWNAHIRTIGVDVVFAMSWRELIKLMTEVYCPRNEIQKMESEL